MNKLLLHTCCATCLAGVIKQLPDKHDVTCYFYNPNIYPKEEYDRRLADVRRYCDKLRIFLVEGEYEPERWFELVKGLESEPEGGSIHRSSSGNESVGGQRCVKCYTIRLEKTAWEAKDRGFDLFTTTLTISPHKKAEIINPIGQALAKKHGIQFLEADFKKRDGFKCACEIAKNEKFYRQNYCGCIFSK